MAVSFASLLRRLPDVEKAAIAQMQLAVLAEYEDRVNQADYRKNYGDWTWEMERLAGR